MDWLPIPVLDAQTPLTLLALLLVPLHRAGCCTARRSAWRVRMVGENPQAAEGQGIDVVAVRTGAIVAGSALMGVAGAFLTLSAFNAFFFNMVNGRGWICVALVVFASWRPGQGAARRAAVRVLRRAAVAPAAVGRRGAALPGLPDAAVRAVDPRAGAGGAPRRVSAGADEAVSQGRALRSPAIYTARHRRANPRRRTMYALPSSLTPAAGPARRFDRTTRRHLGWAWLAVLGGIAYLVVLTAWSAPGSGTDEPPAQTEASIKAAFLYRFLGYVEWRSDAFAQPSSPVVIGVLGADDIVDALRPLVGVRKPGERRIEVRRVSAGAPLTNVHMLFVGRSQSSQVRKLADAAQRRGVLLVTDHEGALDEGSAINLVVIENRVRFEVSLDATERAGLKLSSRMLAVALWVRPAR